MNDSIFDALTNNFGFTTVEIEEGGLGQGQTRRLKVVADGQKYMAKHLASDITPDFECEFLQFIGKNGVPVAKNILTKKGEPFVVCDQRPLVLYEWADGGISWPTKPELAALLGKAIARMHLVSGAMPPVSNTVVYSADRLIKSRKFRSLHLSLGQSMETFIKATVSSQKKERLNCSIFPWLGSAIAPTTLPVSFGRCETIR